MRKLFCADCGGKMYYRRAGERAGRNWRGLPDGTVRKTPANFNCGTYNNSRKQNDKKCSSHCIQEDAVKQLFLETIRYACDSARMKRNWLKGKKNRDSVNGMQCTRV